MLPDLGLPGNISGSLKIKVPIVHNAGATAVVPSSRTQDMHVGALVILKAESRASGAENGTWNVLVNGKRFLASVGIALEKGASYRAIIEKADSSLLNVKILSRSPENRYVEILSSLKIPVDRFSQAALGAFMRENMPLDARLLLRLRRSLERRGRSDDAEADAAFAALEKGFSLDAVDGFLDALDGIKSTGAETGSSYSLDQAEEPSVAQDDETADEESNVRLMASFLKDLVLRTGSESLSGDAVGLFNHIGAKTSPWIYVPYAFELDDMRFSGLLKIRFSMDARSCDLLSGSGEVSAIKAPGGTGINIKTSYNFIVRPGLSGKPRVSVEILDPDTREVLDSVVKKLKQRLADSGIDLDDPCPQGNEGFVGVDCHA